LRWLPWRYLRRRSLLDSLKEIRQPTGRDSLATETGS